MKPDKSTLVFSINKCQCGNDLVGKITPDVEEGFNEDRTPRITGFCPKCGRGYAMKLKEPTEEALPFSEPTKVDIKGMAWGDLKALGKTLGITKMMKRQELESAVMEAQNAI